MTKQVSQFVIAAAAVAIATVGLGARSAATDAFSVAELPRHTHIHGLAVDRQDSSRLFIATHHGLFRGYLLHLAVDPTNPNRFFAATGKGRVLTSTDRRRSWNTFGASRS